MPISSYYITFLAGIPPILPINKGIYCVLLFHHLDKSEHFVRTFVGIVFVIVGHLVVGLKILAPKLIDLEAALVHVEMNISLLEIGGAGLPNLGFGVESLNRLPSTVADAFGVFLGSNEQDLKLVVICFFVDLQDHAANLLAVHNNAICFAIGSVDTTLDRFARDDLAVEIKVVVAFAELLNRAVLECPLIIKNELLAIVLGQGDKLNFCIFHNYLQKIARAIA